MASHLVATPSTPDITSYKDGSNFERESKFFQSPEFEEDMENLVMVAILEPHRIFALL